MIFSLLTFRLSTYNIQNTAHMYYYICTSADYVSMCTSMCCIDSNGETSRIAVSVYRVGLNTHVHYWRQLYICFLFILLFFFFIALRAVTCSIRWQFSFVDLIYIKLTKAIFYLFNPDNDDSIASGRREIELREENLFCCRTKCNWYLDYRTVYNYIHIVLVLK